jgi:heme/copper-type cytochrome/quinol oxidase subunit 3
VIREAIIEGQHTKRVQIGLKMGMILFIVSEIMFFFAFF